MYLKEIKEIGNDGEAKPPYKFNYHHGDQLPPRMSFSQDHWGYYNGKTNLVNFTPYLESFLFSQYQD